jgi:hypothetical protein
VSEFQESKQIRGRLEMPESELFAIKT